MIKAGVPEVGSEGGFVTAAEVYQVPATEHDIVLVIDRFKHDAAQGVVVVASAAVLHIDGAKAAETEVGGVHVSGGRQSCVFLLDYVLRSRGCVPYASTANCSTGSSSGPVHAWESIGVYSGDIAIF